jgi:hypothetical protein
VKVAILEPSPGAGVFPAKVHKRWPNICLQRLAIISKNSRRTKTWIGSICSRHRSLGSRTLTGLTFAEHWQSAARDLGLSIRTDFIASPLHRLVRAAAATPVAYRFFAAGAFSGC